MPPFPAGLNIASGGNGPGSKAARLARQLFHHLEATRRDVRQVRMRAHGLEQLAPHVSLIRGAVLPRIDAAERVAGRVGQPDLGDQARERSGPIRVRDRFLTTWQ